MKQVLIGAAFVALAGCVSVTASDVTTQINLQPSDVEARSIIEDRNTLYEELVARQDVDGLMALHTDDYAILRPGGANVEGEAAQRAYWEAAFETMNGLKIDEKTVFFAGPDTIISRDTYRTFRDGEVLNVGQSLIIWKKTEGEWLVYWEMFN